jgi:hypothetical protein
VVGVKKLPSGDLVLQLKERGGKDTLTRRPALLEQVAPSAHIVPDLYPVLVHGVRISNIKTTDQKAAARHIELQNATLHPGLCVRRASWPRGIQNSGKRYSSLTIYLTSPETANRVVEKGLVRGGEVKEAERFLTGLGLVQCFKCCAYGHIAKHCRVSPRCGHCSQSHETRSCGQKGKSVCPNCIGKGKDSSHKAWAETCPMCTVTAWPKGISRWRYLAKGPTTEESHDGDIVGNHLLYLRKY